MTKIFSNEAKNTAYNMIILVALLMAISTNALAQTYIITSSNGSFTANRDGWTSGATSIQNVIDAIRDDDDRTQNITIQFGNGDDWLDIGAAQVNFNNTGGSWRSNVDINLMGRITSRNSINTQQETIFIDISEGATIKSMADIEHTTTNSGRAITNNGDATLNITEGTISALGNAIRNNSTGAINISGGTVSATREIAISNNGLGVVTISQDDPDIPTLIRREPSNSAAPTIAIYGSGNAEPRLIISGGTIENASFDSAITNSSTGAVNISGGTISATIQNNSTGTVNISGGSLSVTGYTVAIWNSSTGAINISGGTVSTTLAPAITNSGSGAINISGGTISATTSWAIRNNSSGVVTISEKNPEIPTLITSMVENPEGDPGEGTIFMSSSTASFTHPRLIIKGGIVENTGTGRAVSIYSALVNNITDAIKITGGTIRAKDGVAIYSNVASVINISQDNPDVPTLITSANSDPSEGAIVLMNSGIATNQTDQILTITGGTIENTGAGNAIYNSTGAINISGGTVSATTGIAIRNEFNGVITISENGVVKSGNTNTSEGTISLAGSGSTSTSLFIGDNGVVSNYDNGNAIYNASSGGVEISGGEVFTTSLGIAVSVSAVTISNVSNGAVTISGGTVWGTNVIHNTSSGVINITGGLVMAYLCAVSATDPSSNLTIGGTGVVLGYRSAAISNVINHSGFDAPQDHAVVIAWDSFAAPNTYNFRESNDLVSVPAGVVWWGYSNGVSGISYSHGTNSGIIEIDGITVHANIDLNDMETTASAGWTFDGNTNIYTIHDGTNVTITGTSADQRRIEVEENATASIMLNNVSITGLGDNQSPLLLNSGANVNLTIEGENTLTAGANRAGIQAPEGTTLTINGAGSLTATGGNGGAGIGGGSGIDGAGGNITINGGTVFATGGSNARGIGRGSDASAEQGTLTMNGNAIVFASSAPEISTDSNGILFIGDSGNVYGNVELENNLEIPEDYILTVPEGAILVIPNDIELANNGVVLNCGTITENGSWKGKQAVSCDATDTDIIDLDIENLLPFGIGWTYANRVYTIHNGANVTITGTATDGRRISISNNAEITLNNVSITGVTSAPLTLTGSATVNLKIKGENTLLGNSVGISIGTTTTTLIIDEDGTGSLTTSGGTSGILVGGTLTINGGTITATGRTGTNGAGISVNHSRTININGGVVTATGTVGIGSLNTNSANININGGTVTATGTNMGVGIGGSGSNTTITISGGIVNAIGGSNGGAGIGSSGGLGSGTRTNNIIITGGQVTATGGDNAAGIGSGTSNSGNSINNIIIDGGSVIATGGGDNIAGIGGGNAIFGSTSINMNGNAIVFASGNILPIGNRTGGILNNEFYGESVTITDDAIIHPAYTLTVPDGATLTVPENKTLFNAGTITIESGGTLVNNGTIKTCGVITGTLTGNAPEHGGDGNIIDLGMPTSNIRCGDGWGFVNNTYFIRNGADVTITGQNAVTQNIVVASGAEANITLNDVSIGSITYHDATLNLTLTGDNNVASIAGTTLTIDGAGSLTTSEGIGSNPISVSGSQAITNNIDITINNGTITTQRIGSNPVTSTSSANITNNINITINNGTITTQGIGSNPVTINQPSTNITNNIDITINNGTITTQGIGSNSVTINTSLNNIIENNNIIINGGFITITEAGGNAGIGSGGISFGITNNSNNSVTITNDITINGGTILINHGAGAAIGSGILNNSNNPNNKIINLININGGIITVTSSNSAVAAIGSGQFRSSISPNNNPFFDNLENNISINGGTVMAIHDNGGMIGRSSLSQNAQGPNILNMEGNAIVFATTVNAVQGNRTGGILFTGNPGVGSFYGSSFTITDDVEIPHGYLLTIPAEAILNIPEGKTLTNNGTVFYCGGAINKGDNSWVGNEPEVSENIINLEDDDPPDAGCGWTYANDVYTVTHRANVIVTGESDSKRIVVTNEARITLRDVSITATGTSPLHLLNNADVIITLEGENTLRGSAGIQTSGATLIINGDGSLTATGGNVGIGNVGNYNNSITNNITIESGTITATALGTGGVGIGGGSVTGVNNRITNNITIAGGSVTATAPTSNGVGIGGGNGSNITNNITIAGGSVTATASTSTGVGIGGGNFANNNIIITGGSVTANGNVGIGRSGSATWGILKLQGNALVFTSSIGAFTETQMESGVIVLNNNITNINITNWYGSNELILTGDVSIPANYALFVDEDKTLTIPQGATLDNKGLVVYTGTIKYNATHGAEYGDWTGNLPMPLGDIDLSVPYPEPPFGVGWRYLNGTYIVSHGANVTFIGTGENKRILVGTNAEASITLKEVTLESPGENLSPLSLGSGATINLTLEGENTLTAESNSAGIHTSNATLVIDGAGSLTATGADSGAGIGSNDDAASAVTNNITINGGIITAIGNVGIGNSSDTEDAGTFVMNNDVLVFTTSVSGFAEKQTESGILVINATTHWYGAPEFSITDDVTIPENFTLTVNKDKTFTIPAGKTLTNDGTVFNFGTLNYGVENGLGIWEGNHPLSDRINMANNSPYSSGYGWTFINGVYAIADGANVTITGVNANQRRIEIEADAKAGITLNDAIIDGLAQEQSPLLLRSGADLILTLEGENILTAGLGSAGIQVPQDASLIISGSGGFLTSIGGSLGAGIGGGDGENGGDISIVSGTVTTHGGANGAGIGGGNGGAGGNISISGGTIEAKGNIGGTDIGAGRNGEEGTFSMDGNAIVFASNISDEDESKRTGGILFVAGIEDGTFYGANITITDDVTIPAYHILTVTAGKTLTIPLGRTLTNNGTVFNFGIINHGYENGFGEWKGNAALNNIIDLTIANPSQSGAGWKYNGGANVYTITAANGETIIITGSSGNSLRRIEVAAQADVHITLVNVSIENLGSEMSPLLLNEDGTKVHVTLVGENVLAAGDRRAGIQVPDGAILIINGGGSLDVTGGELAAGIGGGRFISGGEITIEGGYITAIGGEFAAGIGGGIDGNGGAIAINGGIVTAYGKEGGEGIGGGRSGASGTLSMNGKAIVFASSVGDTSEKENGILFNGDSGTVYGSVAIEADAEIPESYTLTVPAGSVLTIPAGITMTNNGVLRDNGIININGNFEGNKILGSFIEHGSTVAATYSPGLTLSVLQLNAGYEWTYPETLLNAGNGQDFPAIYIRTNNFYAPANGYIAVNIAKAPGASLTVVPTRHNVTHNSLNVNIIPAPSNGQSVEYAIVENIPTPSHISEWQSSASFTSLKSNALYYVFARAAENVNFLAGEMVVSTHLLTNFNFVTSSETPEHVNTMRAWMQNGRLHISGLTIGETVSIYNIAGMLLYRDVAAAEQIDVAPPTRAGAYIVQSGGRVVRVVNNDI